MSDPTISIIFWHLRVYFAFTDDYDFFWRLQELDFEFANDYLRFPMSAEANFEFIDNYD